ncbi:hypothetical protein OED52_17320 [Rhodococcus sp. Z13]|uniref:Uncharacterized protein n=1 Tax=Rhodococcus sacchari TaxID=2962047 RepID=A0ACD4DEF1_9NOCA|nr:hypothetical protein [Rhodococcus sp. Z13]UYP18399.1 hypothetical protein OED52_17320 [Rhodococcus sp. Z13]
MTNPQDPTDPRDPRTPQERAYALDEPEARTQAIGDADATRVLHTDDPTVAYGRPVTNPTLPYTQYQPTQYQPMGRPDEEYRPTQAYPPPAGYQPTQAYPTQAYPTQAYPTQAYPTQGYPVQGYPPAGTPPPGSTPPGSTPPGSTPNPEPGKSPRGPRWGLIALAAVVLIALGGTVGYLLSRTEETPGRSASGPNTATLVPAPPAETRPSPPPSPSEELPLDRLPGGIGEIMEDAGAVVGTITANDGTSITLEVVGGTTVTVLLTPETAIITLTGDTPDSLRVGATAVATGSAVEGGRMTADTVISASIPSFGGPGR